MGAAEVGASKSKAPWLYVLAVLAVAYGGQISAQQSAGKKDAPNSEFAEITARGRLLAEYDAAAWHSTDAVQGLNPKEGSVNRYVGRKTKSGWTVAYGRIADTFDKFLIAYEAVQGDSPEKFTVKEHNPPLADTGYFLHAARANETARDNYVHENRAFNVDVLPADGGKFWVYVIPAQLKEGSYPFGGDARYLISDDGWTILEKKQLHDPVIDEKDDAKDPNPPAFRHHTNTASEVPVETDVFYVLSRKPLIPEHLTAGKNKYVIKTDGTIEVSK